MTTRSLARAILAFYVTLGLVVLVQSVQTILQAQRGQIAGPDRQHAFILGTVEALAALLFLLPRTMRIGAVALLAVFALAFGLHALGGELPLGLLIYAAGVAFVLVHGVRGYRGQAVS